MSSEVRVGRRRRRLIRLLGGLGLVLSAWALVGGTGPAQAQPRQAAVTEAVSPLSFSQVFPRRVTFAAVGDSMTAGDSVDIDHGDAGSRSWARYAQTKNLDFIGGWALGGTTTATMALHVEPYRADVLVVMAGTNDFLQGVPFKQSARNIETIVQEAEVPTVIVARLAPNDADPQASLSFSRQLQGLAATNGWTYVDPMSGIRTPENRYRAGLTDDGIHPVPIAARSIGLSLRAAIDEVAVTRLR